MHDLTWLRSDLPLKKSVILSPMALANITITRNNVGLPEFFIARLPKLEFQSVQQRLVSENVRALCQEVFEFLCPDIVQLNRLYLANVFI